jgi:hypothetical protein
VDAVDIFGPIASFMGVLMSLSPIFQIRRVLERRHSADVSIAMPIVDRHRGGRVDRLRTSVIVVRRYRRRVEPSRAPV